MLDSKEKDAIVYDLLNRGHCIHVKAMGTSMSPFIMNEDRVLIEPRQAIEFKIGDVVLYQNEGAAYVVHRIINKLDQDTVITRGDSLGWNDTPISADKIMGRAIQVESRGKRVLLKGNIYYIFARLIAWFTSSHIRGKRIVVWHLGRLYWRINGRQIT